VGVVAALWFGVNDLGLVMGLAMVTVLAAGALAGSLIPLLLTRLGVDPAVSSGPFVTTVTDVVGFLSFLGIANALVRTELSGLPCLFGGGTGGPILTFASLLGGLSCGRALLRMLESKDTSKYRFLVELCI